MDLLSNSALVQDQRIGSYAVSSVTLRIRRQATHLSVETGLLP